MKSVLFLFLLADRTAHAVWWLIRVILSSVSLSVCLSVTNCRLLWLNNNPIAKVSDMRMGSTAHRDTILQL